MIAFVRSNFTLFVLKHASGRVCRSPVPFYFHFHYFSTSQLRNSPSIADVLVRYYDFPPEFASNVASELSCSRNSGNAIPILSFLNETGFSNTQLLKIVKYRPRILAASFEDIIKPKIKIFQDFGFPSKDICKMISGNPAILEISVNDNIIPTLSMMEGLLGSTQEVARTIRNDPRMLTMNLENNVLPNVEFFKSCGIPMCRIRKVLRNFPNYFRTKPEVVRESVEKSKEMGIDASSKSHIYAVLTVASMSNEVLEIKLQGLRDLGFSDSHILTMFSKAPMVLQFSVEKVKKVKDLLLATGKFDLSSIVGYPMSLGYSSEKRYTPRLRILGILEIRNLIEEWPGLRTLCGITDAKFFEKFIRPNLNEISDVYVPKSSSSGTREDYSSGLR